MRARTLRTVVLAVLVATACHSDEPTRGTGGRSRVLFIGNSLTYTNDLPRAVADLVALGGDSVDVESVTDANTALIDHATGLTNAPGVIARGGWDYVVMQQGPTWPGLCGDTLSLGTKLLGDMVKKVSGRSALLMAWASRSDMQYFDGVISAYSHAASVNNALLIPAGVAWRIAMEREPSLELYGSDDYHPAPLGTYLTALVVYEKLTGRDATLLPPDVRIRGELLPVEPGLVRVLQEAAHAANTQPLGAQSMSALHTASITC